MTAESKAKVGKDDVVIRLPDGGHYAVPRARLEEFRLSNESVDELIKSAAPPFTPTPMAASVASAAPLAAVGLPVGLPPMVGMPVAHVLGPVPVGAPFPPGPSLSPAAALGAPAPGFAAPVGVGGRAPVLVGPSPISGPHIMYVP